MRKEMLHAMRGRFLVWLALLLLGAAGGLIMDWFWFRSWLINPLWHVGAFLVGVLLLSLLRRGARNTGRYLARRGHAADNSSFEPDRLVDSGVYACMRHPMHFALLLAPPALAFLMGSISFILFFAPMEMLLIVALVKFVEEPGARQKFGDVYRDYQRRVPFFSLRCSCLAELFSRL